MVPATDLATDPRAAPLTAASSVLSVSPSVIRQGAIAFLGEIYKNDTEWGQEPQLKQCILDILLRLGSVSGVADQGNG
jgi:hypothetical protein